MSRPVKFLVLVFGAVLLLVAGSWAYVASKTLSRFESLLVCSQGLDFTTPKALCQAYLFEFGGKPEEITALNRSGGLVWVIDAEDEGDRKKLVAFLLEKGVDINAVDRRSGLTTLHGAVLENRRPPAFQ